MLFCSQQPLGCLGDDELNDSCHQCPVNSLVFPEHESHHLERERGGGKQGEREGHVQYTYVQYIQSQVIMLVHVHTYTA